MDPAAAFALGVVVGAVVPPLGGWLAAGVRQERMRRFTDGGG